MPEPPTCKACRMIYGAVDSNGLCSKPACHKMYEDYLKLPDEEREAQTFTQWCVDQDYGILIW